MPTTRPSGTSIPLEGTRRDLRLFRFRRLEAGRLLMRFRLFHLRNAQQVAIRIATAVSGNAYRNRAYSRMIAAA